MAKTTLYSVFLFDDVCLKKAFVAICCTVCFSAAAFCQEYGLTFQSHNVAAEKRTSLDLTPDNPICLDGQFELSFDLSMIQQRDTYFGYIFRMVDNQQKNIDLIYEVDTMKLVLAGRESTILFRLDCKQLAAWSKVKIGFDTRTGLITALVNGKTYTDRVGFLKPKACYKFLFGANNYQNFKTTDVPPVRLRDIRLSGSGGTHLHWPLNESAADSLAHESRTKQTGVVRNPLWVKNEHNSWQLLTKLTVPGDASSCFNPQTSDIYFVSTDTVFAYNAGNQKMLALFSRSGRQHIHPGSQSLFLADQQKLLNFFVDNRAKSFFDLSTQRWDQNPFDPEQTIYWHVNKFYSAAEQAVYVLGGYGQHQYKNTVFRFTSKGSRWDLLRTKGEFYAPRYLAALGTNAAADTAYIIGGYGSQSGKQAENPGYFYDMLMFTPADTSIKRLFQLQTPSADFTFGNDLIIDPPSRTYYGLIFDPNRYESSLQLIRGSLAGPDIQWLGDPIPFTFHDTNSFANLYFSERDKKLYLVTLFWSEGTDNTVASIYQLAFPPAVHTPRPAAHTPSSANRPFLWFIPAVLAIVAAWWLIKRRRKPKVAVQAFNEVDVPENTVEVQKSAIYLFGDFQLFSASGEDMVKYFTPLLKEIFVVILLHSIRYKSGISSDKLNEMFWFDKSEKSARNNRSVNMAKLKSLLEKIGHCQLSKDSGYWKIVFDDKHMYNDYASYLRIAAHKAALTRKNIEELMAITQRGAFLSNLPFLTLDQFKSEVADEVTTMYITYAHHTGIDADPTHIVEVSHHIFKFDQVSEEAMVLKCKALVLLGQHSLAKVAYETFVKNYRDIYQVDYNENFLEILDRKFVR